MHSELVVGRALACVEVVHDDRADLHASKQVTTIGENNLTARLDADVLVLLNRVLEHVHHSYSIVETNHDLEASWVEGHTISTLLELLVDLQLKANLRIVAPDLDCLVGGASGDQVLLNAHVHACDGTGVERVDQVLVHGLNVARVVQIDGHLVDLLVLRCENQRVLA